MSIGLLLSLAAGLTWSLVNVIDKTVVSKYIRDPGFMFVIFCVVSLGIGVVILPFVPARFTPTAWGWIILSAAVYAFGILFYFKAMQKDEASRVVPLFSLSTVFIVLISGFSIGEVFGPVTYMGIALIVFGSMALSARNSLFDSFRSRALWLMFFSCLGLAVSYVINKHLLASYGYWQIFGWQRTLIALFGFAFVVSQVGAIREVWRQTRIRYSMLSGFAEVMNVGGAMLFLAASAFWFVALVEAAVSVQYVFIFVWGLVVTKFMPQLYTEAMGRKALAQKIVSICLIVGGILLISR